MKSYCPAAFKEIYSDNNGLYKLCCHAWPSKSLSDINDQDVPPFEFFLSDAMEEIRVKMLSGETIPECYKCNVAEKDGITSYRQKYIERYGFTDDISEVKLKLRINGSFCNLGCYMCHPYNSSTRRTEMKEVYGSKEKFIEQFPLPKKLEGKINPNHFAFDNKAFRHDRWESILQNILENIHLIKQLHMTGGEPLQLPKHWEFLDKIPNEHAKNIELVYDTNATEIRYKNHSIYEVKDKFKKVFFSVSCDHYKEKLEWIRYPIDVKSFEDNIKEMKDNDFDFCIAITTSILNIDDIDEIEKYYADMGIPTSFTGVVVTPRMLSICNLPDKMKEKYIEKYSGSNKNFIINELMKPSWGLLDDGLRYCDDLSKHRNFDFRELWKDWLEDVESYRS